MGYLRTIPRHEGGNHPGQLHGKKGYLLIGLSPVMDMGAAISLGLARSAADTGGRTPFCAVNIDPGDQVTLYP